MSSIAAALRCTRVWSLPITSRSPYPAISSTRPSRRFTADGLEIDLFKCGGQHAGSVHVLTVRARARRPASGHPRGLLPETSVSPRSSRSPRRGDARARAGVPADTTLPPSRITTRSQTSSISLRRCEFRRYGHAALAAAPRGACAPLRLPTGSSALVGSSSSGSGGDPTSAWAIPSRCCIPFDIASTWSACAPPPSPTSSSSSRRARAHHLASPARRWCMLEQLVRRHPSGKRNSSARYPIAARASREPARAPQTSTADAQAMARRAARDDGVWSGPSSGANIHRRPGRRAPARGARGSHDPGDSGLKYLSGELYT